MVENKISSKLRMFSDSDCVNRTQGDWNEWNLDFPVFLLLLVVWNMCESLHYESVYVYFKELHNDQEYY